MMNTKPFPLNKPADVLFITPPMQPSKTDHFRMAFLKQRLEAGDIIAVVSYEAEIDWKKYENAPDNCNRRRWHHC